jgi:hypothetical protein
MNTKALKKRIIDRLVPIAQHSIADGHDPLKSYRINA